MKKVSILYVDITKYEIRNENDDLTMFPTIQVVFLLIS